jgi:GT2 family glycosyltransferase
MTRTPRATIVIPTYQYRPALAEYLPSVVEAAAAEPPAPIIVVDDGSTDGTAEFLREAFPQVRVARQARNMGFVAAVARGVEEAATEIVVLLNCDMRVARDFLPPLLEALEDPGTFAAVSTIYQMAEGGRCESIAQGAFERGIFRLRFLGECRPTDRDKPVPVLYACGGAMAFRRALFLELGGFDPMYHPYYWEDADLGYRAWKAGYRSVYAPRSVVYHFHPGPVQRSQAPGRIERIQQRNRFLFMWKNLTDPWMLAAHLLLLGPHAAASAATGRWRFVAALAQAAARLPQALRGRRRVKRVFVRSDREVLRLSSPMPYLEPGASGPP